MSFKIESPTVQLENQISNLTNNLYIFPSTLTSGSESSQVSLLQQKLNQLGFTDSNGNTLVVDGDFGAKTTFAVNAYKSSKNLNQNGKVNSITWYLLFPPIQL